jgi:hypothetical protein
MASEASGRGRAAPPLLLALVLLAGPIAAVQGTAQEAAGKAEASVLLLPVLTPSAPADGERPVSADEASYAESLRSGLAANLEAAGYAITGDEKPLEGAAPEPVEAAARARAAGARWAAACGLSLSGDRIAYRVAIYDSEDGDLASGDAFSALAGLAAVQLMRDATTRVVQRLAGYETEMTGAPRRLVAYRVLVRCPVEGAEIRLDSPGHRAGESLGRISGGRLELPYYPFLQGSTLYVSATVKGGARILGEAALGTEPVTVELSVPRPRLDFLAGTGTGRLAGASGAVRFYYDPDWSYFYFEDRAYVGYDMQQGSTPLFHDELRYGLGWYLFAPPASKFRVGYSLGLGVIFTPMTLAGSDTRLLSDLILYPVEACAEYRFWKDAAIWLTIAPAFSIGSGGSGLLGRGWVSQGAPSFSAGMLWRRR